MSDRIDETGERIPIWVFLLVFLGSPVVMAVFVLVLQFRHELASSPLALGLIIGHALSALALLLVWLWRRRAKQDA